MELTLTENDDLPISLTVYNRLIVEARAAYPQECCGILLGKSGHINDLLPAVNVHSNPQTHFEINPQTLIDAHRAARNGGPQVLGYYHSHPEGEPVPSETDRASRSGDRRIWAIISKQGVMFWQDDPEGFHALSYEVLDR